MSGKITHKELIKLLDYNENTGIFTNKLDRHLSKKGAVVGRLGANGYLKMRINGKMYSAHRVAWLYVYGYFPENEIDHINRIKIDNRIKNLREATRLCNAKNRSVDKRNKHGVTGVFFNKSCKKWKAYITSDKKNNYLGCYSELKDAVEVRWEAEKKFNFPSCNTTSSAYNFLKDNNLLKCL